MKYKVPITVVMPFFNTEKFIDLAIKSILSQVFKDFEFLIINDGSTDNCESVVKSYSDKRIKYISLGRNKGNYVARNEGLKLAQGKYIAVMDSDDIASETRLAEQFEYLESHPKVGCLGSQAELINEKGEKIGNVKKPLNFSKIKTYLIKDNCTIHPSLMLRNSLLNKHRLRYDSQLRYAADYEFVVRCSETFPIVNMDKELIKYRYHSQQISSKNFVDQKMIADQIRLRQLDYFSLNIKTKERMAYLNLLKTNSLSRESIEIGIGVFNQIIIKNEITKKYNKTHLYSFFRDLTIIALKNLNLRMPDEVVKSQSTGKNVGFGPRRPKYEIKVK